MIVSRKQLSIIIPALMSSALLTLAAGGASAQTEQNNDNGSLHYSDVEEIVVRALPLGRTRLQSAQPVDVMTGENLADRRGMTLGETLQQQPGVQSSFYGAGSGRPIIRGLGGPRVRILEDGLATADTSTQSDDHAVTVDPMLIDQIEILRGPATLLYGSSASAGVVNIIDGRIPEERAEEPLSGRFEVRGDNVADERSGVLRLDGGAGNIAWHLDGSWREADDYRIPGEARFDDGHDDHAHEDEDHDEAGHEEGHDDEHSDSNRLFNSFVESQSGTAGLSWIGDRGFIGGSFRAYNSEYGIPAPHFHAEEEHDHDEEEHADEEHGEEEHGEEEEFAYIDMEQRSWDIKGGLMSPMRGINKATIRVGYNDYTHSEIELEGLHGDEGHEDEGHEDEHDEHGHGEGTVFDVQTLQSRLSFETAPAWGWEGAFGLQLERED
ncbi:MAG: TonB-dependent receptor plug domain-containing protein, partial [Pseudohongiella sp.]